MSQIFRESSLEKLSSPERLDRLVRLTSPRSFFSLLALGIMIVSIIVWGFVGTIPKKYSGQGVLISGGVANIQTSFSGTISDVTVKKGDYVLAGDVIARINQKDIINKLDQLVNNLSIVTTYNQKTINNSIDSKKVDISNLQLDLSASELKSNKLSLDVESIKEELAVYTYMYEKEVSSYEITNSYDAKVRRDQQKINVNACQLNFENTLLSQTLELQYQEKLYASIETENQNLLLLEDSLIHNSEEMKLAEEIKMYKGMLNNCEIRSAYEGKIMAVNIEVASYVQSGQIAATVLRQGSAYASNSMYFYLPVERGQAISPGMEVNVYPSIYNRQEYGHMSAVVTNVSQYPVTYDEIRKQIGNDQLTEQFLKQGVLVAIEAYLLVDESTESGYFWSSKKGKTVTLPEGTVCDVSVTIEENRPITMVVPLIKETLLP